MPSCEGEVLNWMNLNRGQKPSKMGVIWTSGRFPMCWLHFCFASLPEVDRFAEGRRGHLIHLVDMGSCGGFRRCHSCGKCSKTERSHLGQVHQWTVKNHPKKARSREAFCLESCVRSQHCQVLLRRYCRFPWTGQSLVTSKAGMTFNCRKMAVTWWQRNTSSKTIDIVSNPQLSKQWQDWLEIYKNCVK